MRGPACVTDAVETLHRIQLQRVFEVAQLALRPAHPQTAVLEHGQSRGIIAAVFQAFQAVQDDGHGWPESDITDDSAH